MTLILSLLGGIWTCVTASTAQEKSLERVVHIVQHDYGQDPSKTAILDIVQQSVSVFNYNRINNNSNFFL